MNATDGFLRPLYYSLALLVLATAILYFAQVVLVPLALAILLAFLLNGPMHWLEVHGLPRALSLPLVALVTFGLLGLFAWITASQVRQLAEELPHYEENVKEKLSPLRDLLERAQALEALSGGNAEKKESPPALERPTVQPSGHVLLSWIPRLVRPLLDVLAHVLLVVVLTVFILARREALRDRFLRLVGERHVARTTRALDEAGQRISRYLLFQASTNCCVGLGIALGLAWIGVPYAALWGLLAAALRFLPYVGIWIAGLLPLLLSVAIFPGWLETLEVLGVFLVIELVVANVIEPVVFGHGTGVSPIALLIVAVFWAWLWGPVGLLLSTPMTVCLVVAGRYVPGLRFLDLLLGEMPPVETPTRFFQRLLAGDEDEAAFLVQEQLQTRPPELVYDELLVPTLVQLRHSSHEHALTEPEERDILQGIRNALENLGPAASAPASEAPHDRLRVFGCAVRGDENAVALDMFGQLVRAQGHDFEVLAPTRLALAAGQQRPDVICVAALPPGGAAQALLQCKRLHAAFPDARLLLARWGAAADPAVVDPTFRAAGVNNVETTLLATLQRLDPGSRAEAPVAASTQP